jgi:hypothetical protein
MLILKTKYILMVISYGFTIVWLKSWLIQDELMRRYNYTNQTRLKL